MLTIAKSRNDNTIQDAFLENQIKTKKLTKIYLRNGICLQGYYIEFFDEAVLISRNKEQQLIYKSSIATIILTSWIIHLLHL